MNKVHIGTSILSRDLVWCDCGRGLSRNGTWLFCPKCGAEIDQESYTAACAEAARYGAMHFTSNDADIVNVLVQIGLLATGWRYGNEGNHLLAIERLVRTVVPGVKQ